MGRQIKKTLEVLYPYLGKEGWFISGSYANLDVNSCNDIDVFFTEKKYLKKAIEKTEKAGKCIYHTGCSSTVNSIIPDMSVQYVHMWFGTPDELLGTMDLNVCRQGILPDGTYIQRPESKGPLRILIPSAHSFSRLKKYCQKYRLSNIQQTHVLKQCIDDYIDNGTIVYDYYKGVSSMHPLNYLLYCEFRHSSGGVAEYLIEQALEYAPELLL